MHAHMRDDICAHKHGTQSTNLASACSYTNLSINQTINQSTKQIKSSVPGVGLPYKAVPLCYVQLLCIFIRQFNVLVQITLPGCLDDGIADGRAAARFPQGLVAGDQLLQLLNRQPLYLLRLLQFIQGFYLIGFRALNIVIVCQLHS